MKAGSIVDVQLTLATGKPLAMRDVSVDVVLYTGRKERYRFDAGVTDEQGRISIAYETLEQARKENQALALMDYNTKLEDCDDSIGLSIPTVDQLQERLAAVAKWYPENEVTLSKRVEATKNDVVKSSRMKIVVTNGTRMKVELSVG